jgi:hypothetical protein
VNRFSVLILRLFFIPKVKTLLEAGDLTAQQKALAEAFQKFYTKSDNGSLKLTQENRLAGEFYSRFAELLRSLRDQSSIGW